MVYIYIHTYIHETEKPFKDSLGYPSNPLNPSNLQNPPSLSNPPNPPSPSHPPNLRFKDSLFSGV